MIRKFSWVKDGRPVIVLIVFKLLVVGGSLAPIRLYLLMLLYLEVASVRCMKILSRSCICTNAILAVSPLR
jgi:hypothetical protein